MASDKEDRRKLPIRSSDKHPNAREIIESHIRAIIREDIISDVGKWERHKRKVEDDKKCYQEAHLRRLQEKRDTFITDVRNMFGQKVVEMISTEDVERYSVGVVKRPKDAEELWYSILKKYDFDQNTSSCLYFIRQGDAIKIGITDDLGRRFAQIKTSTALPCEIENVVYTHHGRMLERKLHDALACYNSHLEWFVLPPRIENALFAAKSVDDIENVLARINADESENVPENETDSSTPPRTPQQDLQRLMEVIDDRIKRKREQMPAESAPDAGAAVGAAPASDNMAALGADIMGGFTLGANEGTGGVFQHNGKTNRGRRLSTTGGIAGTLRIVEEARLFDGEAEADAGHHTILGQDAA